MFVAKAKESPKGLEDRDRRRFHRWDVSIPCTVEWEDTITRGQIANLSYGGASITQVNDVPSEGARVLLTFHTRVGGVTLKNKRVARVVYVFLEAMEELIISSIGSFRVEFEEPTEQVMGKLFFGTLTAPESPSAQSASLEVSHPGTGKHL